MGEQERVLSALLFINIGNPYPVTCQCPYMTHGQVQLFLSVSYSLAGCW